MDNLQDFPEFEFFQDEVRSADTTSLTYQIKQAEYQLALNKLKKSARTFRASRIGDCPALQTMDILGYEPMSWAFRWSDSEAAESGNFIHEVVGRQLLNAGRLAQVHYFTRERDDASTKAFQLQRNRAVTIPAIEVNLENYLYPATSLQRKQYDKLGIILPDEAPYKEITEHQFSVINDFIGLKDIKKKDGSIVTYEVPIEAKSIKNEYEDGERNDYLYDAKELHWMFQLQMQIHFTRTTLNQRPRFGILYIINRNNPEIRKEKIVYYNREFVHYWLGQIKIMKSYTDRGEVAPAKPDKFTCGRCPFHIHCKHPGKFDSASAPKMFQYPKIVRKDDLEKAS